MKNNYFFLLIIITLLLVMPMLLMLHGLFPRLDTDYDSNLPIYYFLTDYIRAHHTLPFSIPYVGTGISVLGDPLSAVLNPLFMLPLLLFGIEGGLKIVFLLLFLLSAITMWIFLSSLSLQKEIRLWGSLLYTFSGAFVARIAAGHIEKFLSYPLIPLFFLLAIKEDVTLVRCIGLAGIFTVILFSGDWYTVWFLSIFLVVVETYYFFTLTHRRTQRVLVFVLTYAFFIILSSPKLIPYLLFVRPHYARYYSIDPFLGSVHFFLEPLAFIMPFQAAFYDRPFLQRHVGFHYNWYEYYAFISPLPLLFLVKLKHLLSDQRVRLFLLLIFVSSLYLALKYTYSPFHWLFIFLHPLQEIRVPQRIIMPTTALVIALLALCAGYYLKTCRSGKTCLLVYACLLASFLWTYAVTFQTLRHSYAPINKEAQSTIARLRQKDHTKFYVATFVPGLQVFLMQEKIYVFNYYYGWRPDKEPSFLSKDEKSVNFSLLRRIRPKYIITIRKDNLTAYNYKPFLRNITLTVWKTDTATVKP